MKKSWNDQHENILRQWGEAAGCYRFMNHRAYLMYKSLSMRFTLPVIILSTITGTANFAQSTLPLSIQPAAPSVIGGLNLIAGLIATVMQFLKINELMENHRTAALSYGLLSRNIRLTLALPREERKKDGLKFVDECKAEYDRLIEQSPSVPINIIKDFETMYKDDEIEFVKPEILDVRPIGILTAITEDTPFARVGKMFQSEESSREGSIDVERGE
jgi:hypothetical protein|tara:strand:- start:2278 stop:2928 length:651 start_codon:yes stop_codon:yes gene_type:complete